MLGCNILLDFSFKQSDKKIVVDSYRDEIIFAQKLLIDAASFGTYHLENKNCEHIPVDPLFGILQ